MSAGKHKLWAVTLLHKGELHVVAVELIPAGTSSEAVAAAVAEVGLTKTRGVKVTRVQHLAGAW